jgi:hypothetical protein
VRLRGQERTGAWTDVPGCNRFSGGEDGAGPRLQPALGAAGRDRHSATVVPIRGVENKKEMMGKPPATRGYAGYVRFFLPDWCANG